MSSTPSSASVGMTSTPCEANTSDANPISIEESATEELPSKKTRTLKSLVWADYERVKKDLDNAWLGDFQKFVANTSLGSAVKKSELEEYLEESLFPVEKDVEFDILHWWKHNGPKFPILARMTQDILAIPTSSVASESSFSKARRIITDTRSSLHFDSVETLMCVKDWIPDIKKNFMETVQTETQMNVNEEDSTISGTTWDTSIEWDTSF